MNLLFITNPVETSNRRDYSLCRRHAKVEYSSISGAGSQQNH
jgi:hypothetical protein